MTVNLSLNPEQEQRLREAALARGVEAEALASEILGQALDQFDTPPRGKKLILGLHEGQGWISDDFDAPLPDSFWQGKE